MYKTLMHTKNKNCIAEFFDTDYKCTYYMIKKMSIFLGHASFFYIREE